MCSLAPLACLQDSNADHLGLRLQNLNTVLSVTGVSTLALVVAYTSYGNKQKALIARTRRAPDGKIMEVPDIEPAAYSLFFNNAAFLVRCACDAADDKMACLPSRSDVPGTVPGVHVLRAATLRPRHGEAVLRCGCWCGRGVRCWCLLPRVVEWLRVRGRLGASLVQFARRTCVFSASFRELGGKATSLHRLRSIMAVAPT